MEKQILQFEESSQFETWLAEHFTQTVGIWIRIAKKGSPQPSITYAQALDCALCYGWIDGQKAKFDEASWLQYFSRRKKNSLWSQVNRIHVARLIGDARMRAPGVEAIEEAKRSGQWDSAYQPTSSREIPEDLEKALQANPQARAFFDTLSSQNRFAFVFRVATAKKPETRQKRVRDFLQMMERGEVFYPKTNNASSTADQGKGAS